MKRITDKYQIDAASGCWLWTASLDKHGYGQVRWNGTTARAHRAVYEMLRGSIPVGLVLDHTCRTARCVNPDHLEPVAQGENLRRAPTSTPSKNKAKTHCKNGHPFDAENTAYRYGGWRVCRECLRIAERKSRAKRSHTIRP